MAIRLPTSTRDQRLWHRHRQLANGRAASGHSEHYYEPEFKGGNFGRETVYSADRSPSPDAGAFSRLERERTQALVTRDVATIRRLHARLRGDLGARPRDEPGRYLALMAEDVFYAALGAQAHMRVQVTPDGNSAVSGEDHVSVRESRPLLAHRYVRAAAR